ncbi:MAG TPA: class I SAM-dependent methyltransferase [Thermodesulfobacteriota bacterium]|nr:class I SAM-dependent methyltransferase [Thermodesulfobacteriota bacterium]
MDGQISEKPDYGNWTPKLMIYVPLTIALLFLTSSLKWSFLLIPATFFMLIAAFLFYVRFKLSPKAGNVQESIWSFVIEHLDWSGEGRALDIGCGNGALTIKLAQKYRKAQVLGIDYWGKRWDYSMSVCERNAAIEGVSDRVAFQRASAASLPFADGYFDAAVSNFVFHEVGGVKDKRDVIREGLRVLKKGGRFAFQDEFLIKKMYGHPDALITTIKSWGIAKVEFIETRELPFIPRLLKAPFILGTMAMIRGEK